MTTTTTPEVQDTSLILVNELQQIVATAPGILSQNIESKTKAINAGRTLIDLASKGMNDVYDQQLSTFIVKAKKTVDNMNERRKPFTQIVDSVKKQFTSLESDLKPIVEEAQKLRDSYATELIKAKLEQDRIAKLKLEHDKELIELKSYCELYIADFFNKSITSTKTDIIQFFNQLTLSNIDEAKGILDTTSDRFDTRFSIPTNIQIDLEVKLCSESEVNKVVQTILSVDYSENKAAYTREIQSTILEYSDKLPSKRAELEAIAKAGVEEKERLERESKEREAAESKRLADEQASREAKAQEEVAISASAASAGAMIDAAVTTSEAMSVKEGYSIKLTNNAGYLLLVQFWFEKEGKTMSPDKLEKYTFDRIKRFCEAYAIKNEEFIQSPLISYKPVYKAK